MSCDLSNSLHMFCKHRRLGSTPICVNVVLSFGMDNLIGRTHPMADDFMLPNLSLFQTMVHLLFFCWVVKKMKFILKKKKELLDKKYVQARKKKENVEP